MNEPNKLTIEADGKSAVEVMRKDLIRDLEKTIRDRALSESYKKIKVKYIVEEIVDVNKHLGLGTYEGLSHDMIKEYMD